MSLRREVVNRDLSDTPTPRPAELHLRKIRDAYGKSPGEGLATHPYIPSSVGPLYVPRVPDVPDIGDLVKTWRKRAGFTQESLALAIRSAGDQLSEAQISHVEAGRRNLSAESTEVVADRLALSADERALLHAARKEYRDLNAAAKSVTGSRRVDQLISAAGARAMAEAKTGVYASILRVVGP
jgi:transcriptional regulator with XRE-family HTH domain